MRCEGCGFEDVTGAVCERCGRPAWPDASEPDAGEPDAPDAVMGEDATPTPTPTPPAFAAPGVPGMDGPAIPPPPPPPPSAAIAGGAEGWPEGPELAPDSGRTGVRTGVIIAAVVAILVLGAGALGAVLLVRSSTVIDDVIADIDGGVYDPDYDPDGIDRGPSGQGDEATLRALRQSCEDGQMQACDDLFWQARPGSDDESFGDTCGGRNEPQGWCVGVYGEVAP